MIVFLLIVLPALLPMVMTIALDPAPGITRSKAEARNLECSGLSEAGARERSPGTIGEPSPRGDFIERRVVLCRERIMRLDERPARDEAILSELSERSAELAEAATALGTELADKTWLVDAHYPDAAVAAKLSFATKNALVERGRRVSDRVPLLAAGDILVLGAMTPEQAYPLACRRLHDEGVISEQEVLLAVVLGHPRETILHAGLCSAGVWRWLR